MVSVLITILVLLASGLGFLAFKFFQEARQMRKRYSPIVDVEAEAERAKMTLDQTRQERREFQTENEKQRTKLSQEYGRHLPSTRS